MFGKRTYTRKKGLDTETNKALLLEHVRRNEKEGSPLRDLQQVLPAMSENQLQHLLATMKLAGEVHVRGKTRAARWHSGAEAESGENS